MGVYARKHAQQMILDGAIPGEKSNLSPRAQLLLLHIAQHFAGDEDRERKLKGAKLWNRDGTYFEGLGKKARAIGYNVPEKIDLGTEQRGEMDAKQIRATKTAVNAAIKELLFHRLIVQTKRGYTGQTAEYSLRFLGKVCSTCSHVVDGEEYMDATLHLPQEVRDSLKEHADDWSNFIVEG